MAQRSTWQGLMSRTDGRFCVTDFALPRFGRGGGDPPRPPKPEPATALISDQCTIRPPHFPPPASPKAELTLPGRLGYNTTRPGSGPRAAVSAAAKFHDLVSGRASGVGPALARLGLRAASLPYGAAVRLRNRLYDRGW